MNHIFSDFHRKLNRTEEDFQSFQTVPLADWKQDAIRWKGFFSTLQQHLEGGEWDVVGNPGGRCPVFRWHWRDGKFLRLKYGELSFRIEVLDDSQQESKWDSWSQSVLHQMDTSELLLKKSPRRMGRRMTVATLEGDYRQAGGDGLLDFEATVQKLKQVEMLMDAALADGD